MGTASIVGPAAAGPISPLCFSGLCSWESCIALAQGKGRTGTQDEVLQHFLAIPGFGTTSWLHLLCAHCYALCSSKTCWKGSGH